MKRTIVISAVILLSATSYANAVNADSPAKKFKNCTELRNVYPNGVAKDAKSAGATGAIVNAKVYKENRSSDRDGDGIACEK
jgi:hypothetical protein